MAKKKNVGFNYLHRHPQVIDYFHQYPEEIEKLGKPRYSIDVS